MAKKIQLSNRTRQRIKDNFAKIKPASLKKNELAYYNKIKAGKARAATAFKDSSGKYYPKQFVKEQIIDVAKEMGISPRAVYNNFKDDIENVFRTGKIDWSINERGINKIEKTYRYKTAQVETSPGVFEDRTTEEIKEAFAELKQHLQWKANRAGTTVAAVIVHTTRDKSGKNLKIQIPDKSQFQGMSFEEIIEYLEEEFPDITVITSERGKKKK